MTHPNEAPYQRMLQTSADNHATALKQRRNAFIASFLLYGAALAFIAVMLFAVDGEAEAQADTPPLDQTGVHWLGTCESDNTPHIEGYFDGEHQWLPQTWAAASVEAGRPDLENLTPNWVDQSTQRQITILWWSSSSHNGPHTQWPNCYDDALRSMGYSAPCIGRNVYGCGAALRNGPAAEGVPSAEGVNPTPPKPEPTAVPAPITHTG